MIAILAAGILFASATALGINLGNVLEAPMEGAWAPAAQEYYFDDYKAAFLRVLSFSFSSVVHVGDFAYDMEEGNSTVGNAFMSLMQGYGATKVRRAGGGVRAKSERAARTF